MKVTVTDAEAGQTFQVQAHVAGHGEGDQHVPPRWVVMEEGKLKPGKKFTRDLAVGSSIHFYLPPPDPEPVEEPRTEDEAG